MAKDYTESDFSILIVDDEDSNLKLLGNVLKKKGYDIESAMNGKETFEWVRKKEFDLILLDVMLPDMDGYDICKQIKSDLAQKHIPIIFLTAKAATADIVKGFEVGGSDYIAKPFMPPELLARVKKEVELKTLRGLLPICSRCKAVRDDNGIWNKIEAYIADHSDAMVSHSICPKCTKELYGDEPWYDKLENPDPD